MTGRRRAAGWEEAASLDIGEVFLYSKQDLEVRL